MLRDFFNRLLNRFRPQRDEFQQNYFVGIDLGTTKTALAYGELEGGDISLLPFSKTDDSDEIPSVVSLSKPKAVLMGEQKYECVVGQKIVKERWQYLRDDQGLVDYGLFHRTKLSLGCGGFNKKDYPEELLKKFPDITPEDIAACILAETRRAYRNFFGEELFRATISVPASWNPEQRRATKMAAYLSGFKDVVLIEEPVAALLSVVSPSQFKDKEDQVMVVDFGGGTCDIAVVTMEGPTIRLLGAGARSRLGGEVIDGILLDDFISKLKAQAKVWSDEGKRKQVLEIEKSSTARSYIRRQLEQFKKEINQLMLNIENGAESVDGDSSSRDILDQMMDKLQPEYTSQNALKRPISIRDLGNIDYELDFQEFRNLLNSPRKEIAEYDGEPPVSVINAFDHLLDAIHEAYLRDKSIDRVYLVGGSSYLFFVRERIQRWMIGHDNPNEKELEIANSKIISPGERVKMVVRGAAKYERERLRDNRALIPKLFYNLSLKGKSPIYVLKDDDIISDGLGLEGITVQPRKYRLAIHDALQPDTSIYLEYTRASETFRDKPIVKEVRHEYAFYPEDLIELGFHISSDNLIFIEGLHHLKSSDHNKRFDIQPLMVVEKYPVRKDENLQTYTDDFNSKISVG